MKAFITGATGFIGSHLAETLVGMGYEVYCMARRTSDLRWLKDREVKLVNGDCSDQGSLHDCVVNCDYVFHLAGVTKARRREEFYSVNAGGTENLLRTVSRNCPDIKRFVYISSLSALGPGREHKSGTDMKPRPVSDYGKSKLQGEEAVLNYKSRLPVTILRPAAVYGPRDREFYLIFKLVKQRIMPYWGNGRTSLVYIDDLIKSIVLASGTKKAAGRIYSISDGNIYTNSEIIHEISSSLNVRVLKIRLPAAALTSIGFFGDIISKMRGEISMINGDKVKELRHKDWICDIARAKSDLGFNPGTGMKKGIKWTADWYRTHRWL